MLFRSLPSLLQLHCLPLLASARSEGDGSCLACAALGGLLEDESDALRLATLKERERVLLWKERELANHVTRCIEGRP